MLLRPRRWAIGTYTSIVSAAMRRFLAGAMWSSVRILCRRSASLNRITRTSDAMASSILRKFSACASIWLWNSIFSSFDKPSTRLATGAPKRSISSSFLTSWSSITSCSSAAMMACASSFQSAQISATASGCEIYGSPDLRICPRCISSEKRYASLTFFSSEGVRYSSSLSVRWVNVATPLCNAGAGSAGGFCEFFFDAERPEDARVVLLVVLDADDGEPRVESVGVRLIRWCCQQHGRGSNSGRHFFQHLDTDLAGCDFAQCGHGWLVLGVHFWCVTLQQLTCAISRSQSQLKAVRDLLEAIFNRDTGHKYS